MPFIDQHEYLCGLLDDPRIEGIGSALLGDDFNYTGSDGNYYVGDTRWHSDGYRDKKYVSLKMAFYLDPVTRDTGCLRVVPGSHRFGDAFAEALEAGYRHTRDGGAVEDWWGVPAAASRPTRWRASRAISSSSIIASSTARGVAARAGACSR